MENKKSILCIGAGYVGGPTMAMIAAKCPDYTVTVADINEERIARWNSDSLPIYEPGLYDVVKQARGRNLFFTTDVEEGIRNAYIIFVSVNTPTKTFGAGAGKAADLQYWEKCARLIAETADSTKIVVEKSTLPVRAAEAIHRILQSNPRGIEFHVLSNPERNAVLQRFVYQPGRLIVWIHAPGILSEGRYDPENVQTLTGIPFGIDDHSIRHFPTHRSVYYATMSDLTARELRRLAKEAGVHLYTPPGNAVWSSDEFLMIHRKDAAEVPVHLPRKATRITELFSGRIAAENTAAFTEHFPDSGTRLYFLE